MLITMKGGTPVSKPLFPILIIVGKSDLLEEGELNKRLRLICVICV